MNLLLIETSHSVGTQTVIRSLIPYFSKTTDKFILSGYGGTRKRYSNEITQESIAFENLAVAKKRTTIWKQRLRKLGRKLNWGCDPVRSRILEIIQEHKITHVFIPWIVDLDIGKLPIPTGSMVMDVSWKSYPEGFLNLGVLESSFRRTLIQTDVLFPISSFTQSELKRHFPEAISSSRSKVVPHGADQLWRKNDQRFSELGKFFFYPAGLTENKNHLLLFQAVEQLCAKRPIRLVLTSRSIKALEDDACSLNAYQQKCKESYLRIIKKFPGSIKILGELAWEEILQLYAQCIAVVLPTNYEGFGLPVVEAIGTGAPAILTDIPPFKEQLDRYDPLENTRMILSDNLSELQKAMENFYDHPPLRTPEVEAQRKIDRWTWEDAAGSYLKELAEVGSK